MTTPTASSDTAVRGLGLSQALALPPFLWLVLAGVMLLAYGYEIFNLNLSIDEELHAGLGLGRRDWLSQGRWGMALVTTVLLRDPVGPVVSTFLGVLGTAIGLVLSLRWTFRLDERATAAVAALAITTPTLAFIFTFSTIAYGVGVAFVAVAVSARYASAYTVRGILLACALGAFSIGVYQPFVVNIALLATINAIHDTRGPVATVLRRYAYWIAYVVGSVVVYFVVSAVAVRLQPIDMQYMGRFVDLAGLWGEAGARIEASYMHLVGALVLRPEMFGGSSPWLAVTIAAAALLAVVNPLVRKLRRGVAVNVAVLVSVAAIAVFAGTMAGGVPPVRSMTYLPVAVAMVAAVGCSDAVPSVRAAFWSLCFLAIVGNAMVNNHLFASAADAEWQDKLVAHEVFKHVKSIDPALVNERKPIKIEVVGMHSWPETALRHTRDTFGASFFGWDGGYRVRVAAYLRLTGLNATWETTAAERARSYEIARTMPAWPREGWVRLSPPDLLILKFGDYNAGQAADLCVWEVKALCAPAR